MRNVFRRPIAWMVLGEIVIVAALVGAAWHVLALGSAEAPVVVLPKVSPLDTSQALPPGVLYPPSPAAPRLLPGLNLDPAFWRARLQALNAAEAQVEALEWRIVHSALDTLQRYIDSVVIPAVERAEKGG